MLEEAKSDSYKILGFAFVTSLVFAFIMFGTAFFVPGIYKVDAGIKDLAKVLIIIVSCVIPFHTVDCCMYFILRTGGKVFITFLFDSFYVIALKLPLVFLLVKFTSLGIVPIFIMANSLDVLKAIPGYILVNKGVWLKIIV